MEAIIDILGANRVRVAILAYLADHPKSTATDIANGIGARRVTVYSHLLDLENAGAVSADIDPQTRTGKLVHFSLNAKKVAVYLASLRQLLHPNKHKK